jgi:hypothetical protein
LTQTPLETSLRSIWTFPCLAAVISSLRKKLGVFMAGGLAAAELQKPPIHKRIFHDQNN